MNLSFQGQDYLFNIKTFAGGLKNTVISSGYPPVDKLNMGKIFSKMLLDISKNHQYIGHVEN